MSQTRASRGSPSTWIADVVHRPRSDAHPNPWNVNKMNAFQYAKLLESIELYGFFDPILARPCGQHGDLEIIGGYHRWLGAGDLGVDPLPFVVKDMDDTTARRISLIDNELHGQADPGALGALLKDLVEDTSLSDSLAALPYTPEILRSLTGLSSLPPLPAAPSPPPGSSSPGEGAANEKWVERTYRMPEGVAGVIDDAIAKAREDFKRISGNPDWETSDFQALEVIAAEYLASG